MLEALEAAVEGLELRLDGDELVAAQRCVDRLAAKLALAYGDFDAHQLWDLDGVNVIVHLDDLLAGRGAGSAPTPP